MNENTVQYFCFKFWKGKHLSRILSAVMFLCLANKLRKNVYKVFVLQFSLYEKYVNKENNKKKHIEPY